MGSATNAVEDKLHTRSSPIGPAEHEEGGSLNFVINRRSCGGMQPATLSSSVAVNMNIPAEICKLLVNSLEGHIGRVVYG